MAAGANYSEFTSVFPEHASIVPAIEKRLKQFEEFTQRVNREQVQSIRPESLPVLRKINEHGFVTIDSQDGNYKESRITIDGEPIMGSNGKQVQNWTIAERAYVEGMMPHKLFEKVKANFPKWSPFEVHDYKSSPKKKMPLVIETAILSNGKKEKIISSNLRLPMEPDFYEFSFKRIADTYENNYGGGVSELSAITPEEWSYVVFVDTRWRKDAWADDGLFTAVAKLLEKSLKDLSKSGGGTRKRKRAGKRKNMSRRR